MNAQEQIGTAILILSLCALGFMFGSLLAGVYDDLPREGAWLQRCVLLALLILLFGNATIFTTLSLLVIAKHLIGALL